MMSRSPAIEKVTKKLDVYQPPGLSRWSSEVNQTSDYRGSMLSLRSTHHSGLPSSTRYPTLGEKILDGKASWCQSLKVNGEFSHIPLYWEWLEDVLGRSKVVLTRARILEAVYASLFPYTRDANVFRAFCECWSATTNTLHTAVGEVSISLWDLYNICGLPIDGEFYDEVVPHHKEFFASDRFGSKAIFRSCRNLFAAYHHISKGKEPSKQGKVSIIEWVNFWFRGPVKYSWSSKKSTKKGTRGANLIGPPPSDRIPEVTDWSDEDHKAFTDIGVEDGNREETYLAAFLSCWLCAFVLPVRDILNIRPSTFRMASMMAKGIPVCLAVPVLASIYRGLGSIVDYSEPGKNNLSFPVHYVYGWIAQYFSTHQPHKVLFGSPLATFSGETSPISFSEKDARDLIMFAPNFAWNSSSSLLKCDENIVDDKSLTSVTCTYLVSLRSSYLVLRCEDLYVVKHYSPHRFCRQFGFCQDLPGDHKLEMPSCSLENLYFLHNTTVRTMSKCTVTVPAFAPDFGSRVTKRYTDWWSKLYGEYFRRHAKVLATPSTQILTDQRVQSVANRKRLSEEAVQPLNHEKGVHSSHLPLVNAQLISKLAQDLQADAVDEGTSLVHRKRRLLIKGPAGGKPKPVNWVIVNEEDTGVHEEGTGDSDRNWKHVGSSQMNHDTIFDGILSSSQPIEVNELDGHTLCVGGLEGEKSEDTVRGPSPFEMALRRVSVVHSTSPFPIGEKATCEEVSSLRQEKRDAMLPPVGVSPPANLQGAPSFSVRAITSEVHRKAAADLGKRILVRFLKPNPEKLLSSKTTFSALLSLIDGYNVDSSPLRARVDAFMLHAETFQALQSEQSTKMTVHDRLQQLASIEEEIKKETALEEEDVSRKASLDNEISSIEEEMKKLEARRQKLQEEVLKVNNHVTTRQSVVSELRSRQELVNQTSTISEEDYAKLEELRSLLGEECKEISTLDWMS